MEAAIRAACAEVNPKIGRVIRQKPLVICDECVDGMTYDANGDGEDSCWNCGGTGAATNPHAGEKKVINQPLHHRIHGYQRDAGLADVLAALGKIGYYSVDSDGRLILNGEWIKQPNGVLAVTWNLPSTLSGQTIETVSAIYQILKGNNAN